MNLFIYFFLGLFPALLFGTRFYIQWLYSERIKQSQIPSIFWYISFVGNALSALHYFIQMQLPFLLIQTSNGYISWRHLQLQKEKQRKGIWKSSCLMAVTLIGTTFLYTLRLQWLEIDFLLFGPPIAFIGRSTETLSPLWICLGVLGSLTFGLRFWVQWIQTELTPETQFSITFWMMSLIGSFLCLIYFMGIKDYTSSINFVCGFIPYTRNLYLMLQKKQGVLQG